MQARSWALFSVASLILIAIVLGLSLPLAAQTSEVNSLLSVRPQNRVTDYVIDAQRVSLSGNRHPQAVVANEVGTAAPDMRMERMILSLKPSAEQQGAMEALAAAQHDPASPYYHQWLTPETYAERFGVSENDVQQVANWLRSHGLTIDEVVLGRTAIIFSGTASQVAEAFQTPIKLYRVDGQPQFANSVDPRIPQALAAVINGPVSLHNFRSQPAYTLSTPELIMGGGAHYLAPADWATIYNVTPLYGQGLDGTGQSIAVLGRADFHLSDVQTFRKMAGLPANDPQVVLNGADPATYEGSDFAEATLDVEWAGAIARNATIKFITSKSDYTTSTDGIALSATYAVTNNVAPIISVSYGQCESYNNSSATTFWKNLWNAATLQGQTVLVAAGDHGANGCGSVNGTPVNTRAVNVFCSTPYSTCVGGTMFNDASNPSVYWSATNRGGMASALGYIPEVAWNESATGGGASGGGVSTLFSKPSWQSGTGVSSDGMRDVPDVALAAGAHDAYAVEINGAPAYLSGTSAATQALASIMALVTQNYAGVQQGNINPALYTLATNQRSGGAAVFHDITSGNNSIPNVSGFSAGTGYDRVTGLGSFDAQMLVNHFNDGNTSNHFALSTAMTSGATVALAPTFSLSGVKTFYHLRSGSGNGGSITVTTTGANGFNSAIALSIAGLPSGMTAIFNPTTIASPGTGSTTLTFAAASTLITGNFALTITATGGGVTQITTTTIAVTSFTLASTAPSNLLPGNSEQLTITETPVNGWSAAAVALSIAGLPTGVTADFSPATMPAGITVSTLTLTAAASTAPGSYPLTISGIYGGFTRTVPITLNVVVPSFTLSASQATGDLKPGASGGIALTTAPVNGFSAAVNLSVSGLPTGVTGTFLTPTLSVAGSGSSKLNFLAAPTTVPGRYPLTITATGGGVTKTVTFILNVPGFTLASPGTAYLYSGGSMPLTITTAVAGGFNAAVALSLTGLPGGITAAFSANTIAAPGAGSSTLTFTQSTAPASGAYTLTLTATGNGITQTRTISLIVSSGTFNLLARLAAGTLKAGTSAGTNFATAGSTGTNGFYADVYWTVSGLPLGVTAAFSPAVTPAPGSGATRLTFTAAATTVGGSYPLTITASGGGVTKTVTFILNIATFNVSNAAAVQIRAGAGMPVKVLTAILGGYNSAIALSIAGLPTGATATFSPTTIAAPGSGSSTLTINLDSTVPAGSYPLTITAAGTAVTKTSALTLNVITASVSTPWFTLTESQALGTLQIGTSGGITVTTTGSTGFNAAVALSVSGLPSGVSAGFATPGIAAPGTGSNTLNFVLSPSVAAGSYPLIITASGGGITHTIAFVLNVPHTATVNWTASPTTDVTAYNVYRGTVAGGPYAKVCTVTAPALSCADATVVSGTTYYYVVTSTNPAGESANSTESQAIIPAT